MKNRKGGYIPSSEPNPTPSSGENPPQIGHTVILPENTSLNPTTKPTRESPAPFAGLIAGLGAAALLMRMRR